MRPDAELGITKPFRVFVLFQRLIGRFELSFWIRNGIKMRRIIIQLSKNTKGTKHQEKRDGTYPEE
jgi:hypothetical protein